MGKSHIIKALHQAALKYYNSRAGLNKIKILWLTPTGKATFLIKGNKIHSTLAINQQASHLRIITNLLTRVGLTP